MALYEGVTKNKLLNKHFLQHKFILSLKSGAKDFERICSTKKNCIWIDAEGILKWWERGGEGGGDMKTKKFLAIEYETMHESRRVQEKDSKAS